MSSGNTNSKQVQTIAVSVDYGRLSTHLGNCELFALFDVDTKSEEILYSREVEPPSVNPSLLSNWLADKDVDLIITESIEQSSWKICVEAGMAIMIGPSGEPPENLIRSYLDGELSVDEKALND